MRSLRISVALLRALATLTAAAFGIATTASCGSSSTSSGAVAPSWTRSVIGDTCDLSLAADIEALTARRSKDPVAGGVIGAGHSSLRSLTPVAFPYGKRVAACARMVPNTGEIASWLVVVEGVPPEVNAALAAKASTTPSITRLPNGSTVIGTDNGAARLFIFKETMVAVGLKEPGSKEVESRISTLKADDVASGIDLPKGMLARASVSGEAAKRISHEWGHDDAWGPFFENLQGVSIDIRVYDDHIRSTAHVTYASSADAERATNAVRTVWTELGALARESRGTGAFGSGSGSGSGSSRRRYGQVLIVARAITKLDVKQDGREVEATLTLLRPSEASKNLPPEATRVEQRGSDDYAGSCPRGQRLDIDSRKCVEVP